MRSIELPSDFPLRVFLPAKLKDLFLEMLMKTHTDCSLHSLYIHNYDNIPNENEMTFFASKFAKIYSVNWLGPRSLAEPIPIGLENYEHLRNGVPKDFENLIRKGLPNFQERGIEIISSFSVSTNYEMRSRAQAFVDSQKNIFQLKQFTTPKEFRKLLINSKFVISPPGNGADCHRTWEAVYLGSVPIVLRDYWPFEDLPLPVLAVNTWEEIPEKIDWYKENRVQPLDVLNIANLFIK